MSTEKDLNYWKENAEEDYKQVPISVLRYITELETAAKNCSIPLVSSSFYCGRNRVFCDEKCSTQCEECKEEYANES